jgi:diguanylate cyclase (GGDEF)-like protein
MSAMSPLPSSESPRVLLHLEDSDDFAALVAALLATEDFAVQRSATLSEAEDAAATGSFDCAFVDLDLPDAYGLEAVIALRAAAPTLPIVVLSGQELASAPVKAILLGAQDWVGKHEVAADRLGQAARLAIARQDANARLAWRAAHCAVTGLPNRHLATEHLVRALARGARQAGGVGVLFCDLDSFKQLNDRLGHAVGDEILRAVAHRLIGAMRPGDTVARWAGDEFLIVAEPLASVETGRTVARRVREAVARPLELRGVTHTVSVTVGVSMAAATTQAQDLIEAADHAMLRAKREGTGLAVHGD